MNVTLELTSFKNMTESKKDKENKERQIRHKHEHSTDDRKTATNKNNTETTFIERNGLRHGTKTVSQRAYLFN